MAELELIADLNDAPPSVPEPVDMAGGGTEEGLPTPPPKPLFRPLFGGRSEMEQFESNFRQAASGEAGVSEFLPGKSLFENVTAEDAAKTGLKVTGGLYGGVKGAAAGAALGGPPGAVAGGVIGAAAGAELGAQSILEVLGLSEPTSTGQKLTNAATDAAWGTVFAGLSPTAVKATAKTVAKTFRVTADVAEAALRTKAPEKILKMLGATKTQLNRTTQKYLVGTYQEFEKQFPEVVERVFNNRSLADADKFIQDSAEKTGKSIGNFFTKGVGKNLFIEESEVLASPIIARVEDLAKNSDVPEIREIASNTLSTITELYKTRIITDPRGTSKAVAIPASRVWKAVQDLTTKLPSNVHSSDGPAAATDLLLDVQNSLRATIRRSLDKAAEAEAASGLSAGVKKVSGEMDLYHYLKSFENLIASAAGQEKAAGGILKYASSKSLPKTLAIGGVTAGGGFLAGPAGAVTGFTLAEGANALNTHSGRVLSKHAIDYIQGIGKTVAEVGSLSVDQAAELQKYAAVFGPSVYNIFEAGREEPQLLPREADEDAFLTIEELAAQNGMLAEGDSLAHMTEEETEVIVGQVLMSPAARGKFKSPPQNSYAWDTRSYFNGKVLDQNERELVRIRIQKDPDLTLEQKAEMLNPLNRDGTVTTLPSPPKIRRRPANTSAPSIVDVLPKGRGVVITDFME